MCTMKEYPNLYYNAEALLRREGLNPKMPGYEFIKKGIVVKKVKKNISNKRLLQEIANGEVIPLNKSKMAVLTDTEQWILESIKAIGIDMSIWAYIKQLSQKLK